MTAERHLPADWTVPAITDYNRAFFTAGVLTVQRCTDCDLVQHPPLDLCHRCQGDSLVYEEASGTGRIDNFTVVHHAASPALADHLPYNVVIVELDDHPGVLVVGNVENAPDRSVLEIGAAVRCVFVRVDNPYGDDEIHLPQWELI